MKLDLPDVPDDPCWSCSGASTGTVTCASASGSARSICWQGRWWRDIHLGKSSDEAVKLISFTKRLGLCHSALVPVSPKL